MVSAGSKIKMLIYTAFFGLMSRLRGPMAREWERLVEDSEVILHAHCKMCQEQ
jgi:hypothetical protein